jgi:hypothetical protein
MRRIALFEHLTKISPCVRVLGVSCKKMCLKNRARSYLNCALGHRYTLDSAREATVAITYDPLRVLKPFRRAFLFLLRYALQSPTTH